MRALRRLGELHLVADEDNVSRSETHRDGVGQGDLPSFVNEEVVESLLKIRAGERPRRAADHNPGPLDCGWNVLRLQVTTVPHLGNRDLDLLLSCFGAHGAEEIQDGLVAVRRYSDAGATNRQRD